MVTGFIMVDQWSVMVKQGEWWLITNKHVENHRQIIANNDG